MLFGVSTLFTRVRAKPDVCASVHCLDRDVSNQLRLMRLPWVWLSFGGFRVIRLNLGSWPYAPSELLC